MGEGQNRNWLERTVLSIGSLLVCATIGILAFDIVATEQRSPDIVVFADRAQRGEQHFAVHVRARNNGTETAQDVVIEVRTGKDGDGETARLEFPYLPGKSTVNGWVTFRQDPTGRALDFRVLGYGTP